MYSLLRIWRGSGKATPWWEVDGVSYVESAIWTAGCNLRCPQCQNYHVTYDNSSKPMTPLKAAKNSPNVGYSITRRGWP